METSKRKLKGAIENQAALLEYLKDKGENHNYYKYYSTHNRIEQAIEECALYLTRGDGWNDLEDELAFSTSRKGFTRFGKCFSFSRSENVAMWMLYGGTDHDGAMLDLTKGFAKKIIATETIQAGYFDDNDKFKSVKSINVKDGCRLFFADILYVGEEQGKFTAKRSDERVDNLECPPSAEGLLTKAYPWSYENEVRLICEIPNGSTPNNADCMRVPLGGTSDGLRARAYSAPNSKSRGYQRSELKGKIDWDICRGCEKHKR